MGNLLPGIQTLLFTELDIKCTIAVQYDTGQWMLCTISLI
jgi:hypothetical protein